MSMQAQSDPARDAVALVVAAGRGTRAGPGGPKQYRAVAGAQVLRRTLAALAAHPRIGAILTVIHEDDMDAYAACVAGLDAPLLPPAIGGAERQDSVRRGLEALEGFPADAPVLIHDAARPFVSPLLIDGALDALAEGWDGACPALAVADTLRRGAAASHLSARAAHLSAGDIIPRDGLWRAQTPQAFRLGPIRAAHAASAGRALTDDVAVAAAWGLRTALTAGDPANFKLTTPEDLARAEALLAPQTSSETQMDIRFGTGFDVHAFAEGDHVTLCGVKIPHPRALSGHSDADVAMHALTDAIFGAIAEGDIGRWFPPSDMQWKGAASDIFLRKAAERVAARGGRIQNVDVTIICERPKIGPHAEAMRATLAEILDLHLDRVSVKATTSEKLGFTGRAEGIAAQAAACVILDGDFA